MLQLKVCGITNVEDAALAIKLGANLLGVIFAENSPRKVTLRQACDISSIAKDRCRLVGVFQNQDLEYIQEARKYCGLDLVQLHGNESAEFVSSTRPSMKALMVDTVLDAACEDYNGSADYILFDRPKDSLLNSYLENAIPKIMATAPATSFFMAGGINTQNVAGVIDRLKTLPTFAGIDIASAIESSPGKKDATRMEEFITVFKEASRHAISR